MLVCPFSESRLKSILNNLNSILLFNILYFCLVVQKWNEMGIQREFFPVSEYTNISHLTHSASLEVFQELFRDVLGNAALFSTNREHLSNTLLQVASISFFISSLLSLFHALSLYKHGFLFLFKV